MPRRFRLSWLCLRRARVCAVVTIDGHNYYLGMFGSEVNRE
jgi:hypothetical protein